MDPVALYQTAPVQTLALDHNWEKMRSRELKFSFWSCSSWSISWRQLDFWITIWRNRDQDLMEAHHFVCSYQDSVQKSLEQVLTYWQLAPRWLREFDLATSYIAIWFLDFMKPIIDYMSTMWHWPRYPITSLVGEKVSEMHLKLTKLARVSRLRLSPMGKTMRQELGHLHHRCYVTCRQIRPRFLN